MLSQIRQISDGNHNTVFVKNKEQKFNLDKEIHDLECWKQSRKHVYRKEERELLAHLEKLRHQQEYLHHLDDERTLHPRGVVPSAGVEQRHSRESRGQSNVDNISEASTPGRAELSLALNVQGPSNFSPHPPPPSSPAVSLPPVRSFTDKKALHRTDAYINICVMCQLPRHSAMQHGCHVAGEAVCCCEHDGNVEPRGRRFTIANLEEHHGSRPPVIEVGQRRHSLMMARLNDDKHEYKPHPPDHSHEGHSKGNHHSLDSANHSIKDHNSHIHDDHGNIRHHHHGHAQQHHGSVHHHHGDVHHHHGVVHNHHDHDHHGHDHHGNASHHHDHDHQGNNHHHHGHVHDHHGSAHHSGNPLHTLPHSTHAHNHQGHNHHGNQTDDATHTPSNSPRKFSRHSISHIGHHNPHISRHDPMHFVHHSVDRIATHGNHVTDHLSSTRRTSEVALGTSTQDTNSDARRRDHELHWDRHQVCKLRGMITDPHYKEQLEVESGKSYPWSAQYQRNKTSSDGIEEMKNCRYLRFSKLNLESMKENPEEEVEVFEKKEDTPS